MKRRNVTIMKWPDENCEAPVTNIQGTGNYFLSCLEIKSMAGGLIRLFVALSPYSKFPSNDDMTEIRSRLGQLVNEGVSGEKLLGGSLMKCVFFIHDVCIHKNEGFCEAAMRVALTIHRKFGITDLERHVSSFSLKQKTQVGYQGRWFDYDDYLRLCLKEQLATVS